MRRKGLRFRLLAAMIPVAVVGVLLLGILSQLTISSLVQRHSADQALQMLEQTERSMQQDIRQYLYTASSLSHDTLLQQYFGELYSGSAEPNTPLLIRQRLSGYFNYSDRFLSVIFFFRDGQMFHYLMPPSQPVAEIRSMDWYQRCMQADANLQILGRADQIPFSYYSSYMFSMAYRPQVTYRDTGIEMIYIALVDGTFENIYKSYEQGTGARIVILDENGYPVGAREHIDEEDEWFRSLAAEGRFSEQQGYFRTRPPGHKVVSYYRSELTGWTLLHILDSAELDSGADRVAGLIIGLSLGVILLFCAVAYFRVGSLTRPLEQLTVRMRSQSGQGADIVVENMPEGDESRQLDAFFQQMQGEINRLLQEVEATERERAAAQIAALQYQISPHFILNTLNAIRTLTITTNADERVRATLLAFTRMLSGCLSDVANTQPLLREKEYLQSYLAIMKLRYSADWEVAVTIPPELENALILKYLLQPLVENCVLHGLVGGSAGGWIHVQAKRLVYDDADDALEIAIADNGVGMSPQTIERILHGGDEKSSGFTRIGVDNVLQRIRLNYPLERYGLDIRSSGGGTCITLTLPLIFEREEAEE